MENALIILVTLVCTFCNSALANLNESSTLYAKGELTIHLE